MYLRFDWYLELEKLAQGKMTKADGQTLAVIALSHLRDPSTASGSRRHKGKS
jgi:hypothetical protein